MHHSTTDFDLWLLEAEVEAPEDYENIMAAITNPGTRQGGFLATERKGQIYVSRENRYCALRLASEQAKSAFLGILDDMCAWA